MYTRDTQKTILGNTVKHTIQQTDNINSSQAKQRTNRFNTNNRSLQRALRTPIQQNQLAFNYKIVSQNIARKLSITDKNTLDAEITLHSEQCRKTRQKSRQDGLTKEFYQHFFTTQDNVYWKYSTKYFTNLQYTTAVIHHT